MSLENSKKEIYQGFETACIDDRATSSYTYRPQFVSNNYKEGKKVLSSIEEDLLSCDEFQISAAFITMSGVIPLLQTFKELEEKNVHGKILTTNYLNFSEPKAIKKLNEFKNIEIKMYDVDSAHEGFHTKGYIFKTDDIYKIIIGSSNLTSSALTSNKEWNTKIISSEHGELTKQIISEFNSLWNSENAIEYTRFFEYYKQKYEQVKEQRIKNSPDMATFVGIHKLEPNSMQKGFIVNLKKILGQKEGTVKALLISATGTGKTYASAFAMRELGFKKALFLVHRSQLAIQSKNSYSRVFDRTVSMGLVGSKHQDYKADYVFATIQTLSKDEHLFDYEKDHFDCIVIDEAHHVTADMYKKVMDHFKPRLWLGMTATPDKCDDNKIGRNVYELFDYNIAYEIRLQKAMEENLLCPFHYFGIQDLPTIDDTEVDFKCLASEERVNKIVKFATYYGYSGERVKGLIFCRNVEETKVLSEKLNNTINPETSKPFRTVALNGDASEEQRQLTFERLAMEEKDSNSELTPLDYILSCDILNEGVDIVEVNQVIMLRPTQSPIVFIQQLGRGLRKAEGKEYVVILDFIGNYKNNFMIPTALSGDRTYNADVIRKYVISGNTVIPGESTIHFDAVSKEKIFNSIDNIKSGQYKKLIKEGYQNLKNRLGRIPMLLDFYKNDEVDPLIIIREYKTYHSFIEKIESENINFPFSDNKILILEYLSKTILNGIRPIELLILSKLLESDAILTDEIVKECKDKYGYLISSSSINDYCSVLNGKFVINENEEKKYSRVNILQHSNDLIRIDDGFKSLISDDVFKCQIEDIVNVGLARYDDRYTNRYNGVPFVLYEKYSRRDVSLLMDAGKDLSSTMYGMAKIKDDVFIFVTYHKEMNTDDNKQYIDGKPDYADEFVDNMIFRWDSQIGSSIDGKYMNKVLESKRKHLFVQKTDSENNFFYMGEFDIVDVKEEKKKNNKGKEQPICKLKFKMHTPVRDDILKYLKNNVINEEL